MAKQGTAASTPRLRFPEYRGKPGWGSSVLGDVSIPITERVGARKRTPVSISAGVGFVPQAEKFGRDISGNQYALYTLIRDGDFVYNKGNSLTFPQGCVYQLHGWGEVAAPHVFISFRINQGIVPEYLQFCFENNFHGVQLRKHITSGARSNGLLNVSKEQFFGIIIPTPAAPEQRKIADCLTSLDEVIAAQGRKVEALKAHKRGLMQQLFPREGEIRPRLRFPEFRNAPEWNERKLGEFIIERNERATADIPLYSLTIEAGVTPKTERYERAFLVSNEADAYKVVKPDDFAFNPMNLRFGAIGRHSGSQPVALSRYYNIFWCDDSVDSRFCDVYFRCGVMVALYDRIATGSLIEKRRVHFDRFLKLDIAFPSRTEQQRIADCLSSLDTQIAAESNQLITLKTHKQGLMQQLFAAPEAS